MAGLDTTTRRLSIRVRAVTRQGVPAIRPEGLRHNAALRVTQRAAGALRHGAHAPQHDAHAPRHGQDTADARLRHGHDTVREGATIRSGCSVHATWAMGVCTVHST